jgi:hypothetical protein
VTSAEPDCGMIDGDSNPRTSWSAGTPADPESGRKHGGGRGATPPTLRAARAGVCLSLIVTSALPGWAAAPTLEHFHPPGVAIDSTNSVRVTGKFEPWPPKVWIDGPGIAFLAQTNKGEFNIIVSPDAPAGVRLVRLFNEDGVSEPRPLVIGTGTELGETEPNDHFAQAQRIEALPATISGRLEKSGDVDSYAIALQAGQTLEARVDSFVLMSRLDAVLRLVTTNGHQLAWNHDFATIDPQLTWQATHDQTVVVQVFGFPYPATADVRLFWGDGAIYRLHLLNQGGSSTPAPAHDLTAEPPAVVMLPFKAAGTIQKPGQLSRVRLQTKQAGWIAAEVRAESIGSPLDAWLRVEDQDGKQLHHNDDARGGRDPHLEWSATANGDYTVVVGSLTRQADAGQRFELRLQPVEPDFEAVVATSSLAVKPGTTNELKVTVTRLRGFTNDLQVLATNLPPGTTCAPVPASEQGGAVTLWLVAESTAMPFQGSFQLIARDVPAGHERFVPFILTGSTTDNGVPGGYRTLLADRTESLWLTVLPAEPPKPEATADKAGN